MRSTLRRRAALLCGHDFANLRQQRLLRRRPRKIRLGPHEPPPDALVFRERPVGLAHHALSLSIFARQQKHRAGFVVPLILDSDHHAIAHTRLRPQSLLEILGINIHPRRSHDHVLLTPLEI